MKPTLLTATLSAAALLGYLSYRGLQHIRAPEPAGTTVSDALPDTLPDFSLEDLAGTQTPISRWSGRPLVINFWATWCAPCLREIPLLKAFQSEHPDIQVIGIAIDRLDPVVSFAEEMDFNYPILQADTMDAATAFGVSVFALPFTVFTAADGATLGVRTGEIHTEHLQNLSSVLDDLAAQHIDTIAARARVAGLR